MTVPRTSDKIVVLCCLRVMEKVHKQIKLHLGDVGDRFQVFWYMVLISYGTGVVHTLSYLVFSVAPDLLYCRCMGEHRNAVQLFTSSQVREASRQFVRKLELGLYVASLRLTSVERYQVKNLNHVFDFLLVYEDSHLICKQSRSDFFTSASSKNFRSNTTPPKG